MYDTFQKRNNKGADKSARNREHKMYFWGTGKQANLISEQYGNRFPLGVPRIYKHYNLAIDCTKFQQLLGL